MKNYPSSSTCASPLSIPSSIQQEIELETHIQDLIEHQIVPEKNEKPIPEILSTCLDCLEAKYEIKKLASQFDDLKKELQFLKNHILKFFSLLYLFN